MNGPGWSAGGANIREAEEAIAEQELAMRRVPQYEIDRIASQRGGLPAYVQGLEANAANEREQLRRQAEHVAGQRDGLFAFAEELEAEAANINEQLRGQQALEALVAYDRKLLRRLTELADTSQADHVDLGPFPSVEKYMEACSKVAAAICKAAGIEYPSDLPISFGVNLPVTVSYVTIKVARALSADGIIRRRVYDLALELVEEWYENLGRKPYQPKYTRKS